MHQLTRKLQKLKTSDKLYQGINIIRPPLLLPTHTMQSCVSGKEIKASQTAEN